MGKNKYLAFFGVLAAVYIGLLFVPGSAERFSLNPEKITQGEYWRFGTYQFVHLNWSHLLQNIIAIVFAVFIALEIKTRFRSLTISHILSGFLALLPLWFIFPFIALGSSTAVFGSFGFLSLQSQTLKVNPLIVILFVSGIIFLKPISSLFCPSCNLDLVVKQSFAHFFGLLFGLSLFFPLRKIDTFLEKKKFVLRRL